MSRRRTSPGYHARTPKPAAPPAPVPPAPPAGTPSPAPQPVPGAERSAPRDPRLNALKHGAFARDLVQTSAPLGENPAEFAALLGALTARYAPSGVEEKAYVERLASLWWRLMRLSRHVSPVLTDWLRRGNDYMEAMERIEALSPAEGRLERSIAHGRRQLAFLQRMRLGRDPVWDEAAATAGAPSESRAPAESAGVPAAPMADARIAAAPMADARIAAAPMADARIAAAPAAAAPVAEVPIAERSEPAGMAAGTGSPAPLAPAAARAEGPLADVLSAARAHAARLRGDALFEASYRRVMGRPYPGTGAGAWPATLPGASEQ
jgi:hypothetical protein